MIYTIKYCSFEEEPQLIDFIRRYWKADHVFVKSKEMFDFQHYNAERQYYEFIIGVNNITHEIDGICGMIPIAHFDSELSPFNETWGGIWKIRDDVHNDEIGLLGLLMFEYYDKYYSHASIGMSEIAFKFHKIKRYTMCYLNQYYILNGQCDDYKIAVVPHRPAQFDNNHSDYSLHPLEDITGADLSNVDNRYWPRKSKTYLLNRFQKHPIYKYSFYGLYKKNHIVDVFVMRKITVNRRSVLRIVDVYGNYDSIPSLYSQFQDLLIEQNCEYVDLMNFGIDKAIFEKMGFTKLNLEEDIIIPNYFEPFEQRNVSLNAAFRSPNPYRMYKADADQDRPNII